MITIIFIVDYQIFINAYSQVPFTTKTIVYALCLFTYPLALFAMYFTSTRINMTAKIILHISVMWLIFLYSAVFTFELGFLKIGEEFSKSVDLAMQHVSLIEGYRRENGCYPNSLNALHDNEKSLSIPKFAYDKYYYESNGQAFKLELHNPEIWTMPYVYDSNTKKWSYIEHPD